MRPLLGQLVTPCTGAIVLAVCWVVLAPILFGLSTTQAITMGLLSAIAFVGGWVGVAWLHTRRQPPRQGPNRQEPTR